MRHVALIFSVCAKNARKFLREKRFSTKIRESDFRPEPRAGNMRKRSAKRVSPVARLGALNGNCG